MLRPVDHGRLRLYRCGHERHTHTLEVSPTRERGRVVAGDEGGWEVTWRGRSLVFSSASGVVAATAHKPSVVRERFELAGPALPVVGAVAISPVRPWWRRWRLTAPDGAVIGRVERSRWPGRIHLLALSGVAEPTDLAAVVGWLVALVTTDPQSGFRRAGEHRRG